MKMNNLRIIALVLMWLPASAVAASSVLYESDPLVIDNGGGPASSATYTTSLSIGKDVLGQAASANYTNEGGPIEIITSASPIATGGGGGGSNTPQSSGVYGGGGCGYAAAAGSPAAGAFAWLGFAGQVMPYLLFVAVACLRSRSTREDQVKQS